MGGGAAGGAAGGACEQGAAGSALKPDSLDCRRACNPACGDRRRRWRSSGRRATLPLHLEPCSHPTVTSHHIDKSSRLSTCYAQRSAAALEELWKDGYFYAPSRYRLAFREFGTTLGVQVRAPGCAVGAGTSRWLFSLAATDPQCCSAAACVRLRVHCCMNATGGNGCQRWCLQC